MKHKVLVVDDEKSIVRLVTFNLAREGFITLQANDGLEALKIIRNENPHLVILDIMLPGLDGLEVCRRIRQQGLQAAIIMLTAKDQEIDRVVGLELGADDYVTKPFSPRELVSRVKAVLRRTLQNNANDNQDADGIVKNGNLIMDVNKFEVKINEQVVELTLKEFELLHILVRNAGRVMTRDMLLNQVWGYAYDGDTRIVDVHVSNIREKIEANPRKPFYIKTLRGLGYKFEGE